MADLTDRKLLTEVAAELTHFAAAMDRRWPHDDIAVLARRIRAHLTRTAPPATGPLCSCGSPSCKEDDDADH